MATAMRKCKVCGELYEYCHTNRRIAGVFRWQDVACCESHGSIYLARIVASRAGADAGVEKLPEPVVDSIEDEEDELFEEDFDDGAEETAIEK